LSQLLGGIEGTRVQVELWAVRILFELLGFLLSATVPRKGLKNFNLRFRSGEARAQREPDRACGSFVV
jgi:hypothetical protein